MKQLISPEQLESLKQRYPEAYIKLINYYYKKYKLQDLESSTLSKILTVGNVLDFIYEHRFEGGYEAELHITSSHSNRQWFLNLGGRPQSQAEELIDAGWFIVCDILLDPKKAPQYR